jgi:hypothetical protein
VPLVELLATARRLRAASGRPVLILMQVPLEPTAPATTWSQGYVGSFSVEPAAVRAFLGATRKIADYAPAITDESYAVYLLP